jgi:predicted nucleotidyltransferase
LKYGLPDSALQSIVDIFRRFPVIDKVVLFGSRAKGNFSAGSDIDMAVFGTFFTSQDLLLLKVRLDDLGLIYKFDPVFYAAIKDPEFKDHIDRVGIQIYQKLGAVI